MQRSKEVIKAPGIGGTDSWERPTWTLRTEPGSSEKVASTFDHRAISLAPQNLKLVGNLLTPSCLGYSEPKVVFLVSSLIGNG